MSCSVIRRYLDAYVDGELDPTTAIDLERHLAACSSCQEAAVFARAMKVHVKSALSDARAPAALRERIVRALDEMPAPRSSARAPFIRIVPMRARHAVPVAAAALVLLGVGVYFRGGEVIAPSAPAQRAAASATGPIFEDVVRVHASDLPADIPGERPQEVTRWFRNKVSFPVRPAEFERTDARLLGARLSNVREQRAAALFYDVGGSRVTVVVFDRPRQLDDGLRRAHLLGREVRYQQVGGYVVPVREQEGLAYAFTGDLDRRSLLRLAATARVQY